MKLSLDIIEPSPKKWVETVMANFDLFLQDHADCERKASSMAMSFVAKYPDRVEIIPELIETALEELEHFRDVYDILQARGIQLSHVIEEDKYVQQLLKFCRHGRDERFMDRLLMASLFETRGAERFKLIWEQLPDGDLKKFYHRLWASEAKHAHIFVKMALEYFDEKDVYPRLEEFIKEEARIILSIPIKAALH